MRRVSIALSCLVLSSPLTAIAPKSLNLDEVMTKEEQKQTGISRLNQSERAQLQIWLSNWTLKLYSNLARNPNMKPGDLAVFGQNMTTNTDYNPQGQILVVEEVYDEGGMLRMADGSAWRVPMDTKKITAKWETDQRIAVYRSRSQTHPYRLVNMVTQESVEARVEFGPNAANQEKSQSGSSKSVQSIGDRGGQVILDDGSRWQISPWDKYRSKLWLNGERIKVGRSGNPSYPFRLTNEDTNESAEAKQLNAPRVDEEPGKQ